MRRIIFQITRFSILDIWKTTLIVKVDPCKYYYAKLNEKNHLRLLIILTYEKINFEMPQYIGNTFFAVCIIWKVISNLGQMDVNLCILNPTQRIQ